MSVDTKGFVATKCKDVFFMTNMVVRALDKLIRPGFKAEGYQVDERQFRFVTVHMSPESECVQLHFTYNGEKRMLWLFFGCDGDHKAFAPKSVSMSMGCWGESDLYTQTALQALSMFGDVYFDHNDCDDVDMAKLDMQPVNFLDACARGFDIASQLSLEKWHNLYQQGMLRSGSMEEVIGMDADAISALLAMNYCEASDRIREMVEPLREALKENEAVLA